MNLHKHFLLTLIAVGILSGSFFSILTVYFFHQEQRAAITTAENSVQSAVADIHNFLDEGGKRQVRQAADQFIAYIDTYLQSHVDATVESMLRDAELEQYRKQARVGTTGYITIMQADNLLFIGHPNKKFVGQPYDNIDVLKDPKFADITKIVHAFRDTQGHVEGYYTWIEPDGRITEKFLSYSISSSTTKDGKRIGVNASTYLDEFNFSTKEAERLFQRGVTDLRISFAEDFNRFTNVLGVLTVVALALLGFSLYADMRRLRKAKK